MAVPSVPGSEHMHCTTSYPPEQACPSDRLCLGKLVAATRLDDGAVGDEGQVGGHTPAATAAQQQFGVSSMH
jgi:hypothetical protein